MKTGIVITTFNRPEYLRQLLSSLTGVKAEILIVDDASTDKETLALIKPYRRIIKQTNTGVSDSVRIGFEELFKTCDVVMNLDSDAIVRPDFIEVLLNLHRRFPSHIITGFNCKTRNANGTERHRLIEQHSDYNLKATVGGINLLFSKETYNLYAKPALEQTAKGGNWDHECCKRSKLPIVSADPSVIQHIGMKSSLGHTTHEQPDTAEDFKELVLPNVTLAVVDCVDIQGAVKAVTKSTKNIQFGDVKILSSIEHHGAIKIHPIKSIQEYSKFIIKDLYKYIHTDYCLIVQADGYVMNHKAWSNDFLSYDYIGAKWWYKDGLNVGNGGFSLRSRKLMEFIANDPTITDLHPEDDRICRKYGRYLQDKGFCFAPENVADRFSIEGNQGKVYYSGSFGFHGKNVVFREQPKLIINQFQGLGDVIFSMSLINEWIKKGFEVIWPVVDGYVNIQKHYPKVKFVPKDSLKINYHSRTFDDTPEGKVIPIYWAHAAQGLPYTKVMQCKYGWFKADWRKWKEAMYERDRAAEDALFYDVLGLSDDKPYTLINKHFRTDQSGVVKVEANGVELRNIPGFTLMDWSKVIENAAEIHTVGTSINYLIELLDCKAKEIHLYLRQPDEKTFDGYKFMLTDKYKYIFHDEKNEVKQAVRA